MRNKKELILFSMIVILFVVLMGLCCYRVYEVVNKVEKNDCCTVIFDTDSDEIIQNVDVSIGTRIDLPSSLVKEGFIFEGWLINGEIYNDDYLVENNITIKAIWTNENDNHVKYYTVVFDDGTNVIKGTKIKDGNTIVFPKTPNKDGYKFGGWIVDNIIVDENYKVTSDIVLKAKWLENYYTISFDTDGGSEVEDIRVKYGTKVKLPSTYKIDYTFNGWIFENKIVDENYEVKNDMLLKANWKRNEEEQIKDDDKEIIEYNFDKIEEFNGDINSIKLLHSFEKSIKARYNDDNINVETLLNNDKKYLKINDNLVDVIIPYYVNAVRVFKFNDTYIIEYSNPGHQCVSKVAIVLNSKGEAVGKIGFEKLSDDIPMTNVNFPFFDIRYDKQNNKIKVFEEYTCGAVAGFRDNLRIYNISENEISLVNHHSNRIFVYEWYSDMYETSHYELENYDLVYTYECTSNECEGYGVDGDNLLIFDDGYYLYNYKTGLKQLFVSSARNGNLFFMTVGNRLVIGGKFDSKYIGFEDKADNKFYIYDKDSQKLVTTFNSKPFLVEIENKKYYFTDTFISDEKGSTIEIYDSNFNKLWIITGMGKNSEYVINSNNTITFNAEKDGVYVLFDSDMNLIHESKKYEMIGITDGYIIVVEENKLKVLDLNQNVVGEFDYLPNAYSFKKYFSRENNNLIISAYDYENDKYVYYYFNTLTKETNVEKD